MQIAIVVPDEQVDEIDALVPGSYRSRAEVVRVALDEFLRAHRRREIDDAYLGGLERSVAADPPVRRVGPGLKPPASWADIPW